MFSGKKVLLGVSGSIAAYKTTYPTRLLIKAGAEVKIVLSPAARDFVTPLSLSTLSRNPVYWDYFDKEDESGQWYNHVDLALWADIMIIAPATANTLSKMASGASDNFLMGVYLSAKCPVYFAPAMDLDMYRHPSTKENIEKLQSFGNHFIPASHGELASGLEGEGRMAEPEEIIEYIENHRRKNLPLSGKKVLINGGPTHEAFDPVRYIGNRSSGKMGIALAESAYEMGAEVHLVLGPTHLKPHQDGIKLLRVESALEMQEKCNQLFPDSDIAILSAAVADYRPKDIKDQKIKKTGGSLNIELTENPDILYELGQQKKENRFLTGFALETENTIFNAGQKLHKKNCDLIVLNSPTKEGTGFGFDTNAVILISKNEEAVHLELSNKSEIAKQILQYITERI